jgi:hypothetical protein
MGEGEFFGLAGVGGSSRTFPSILKQETKIMGTKMTKGKLGLAIMVVLVVGDISLRVQGEQQGDLERFMRQKLDRSQKVLEGLTLEDYTLVAENARALKELSEDTRWRVSPNVNYLRMSAEFQDLAGEVAEKAREKNLDGATLAYVRLTLSCVKCHQYTRDNRITRLESGASSKRF